MTAQTHYQRLGAVHLPNPNIHSFLKIESGPIERNHGVVFLDTYKFHQIWQDKHPECYSPPGPTDEWDEKTVSAIAWRILKGPRQPINLPQLSYDEKGFNIVGLDSLFMQIFYEWEAKVTPVVVPHSSVDAVQETAGAESHQPVQGSSYLKSSETTLTGFRERMPIAELYKIDHSKPDMFNEVMQGIRDYAHLIHSQLEIMLVRHILYLRNTTFVPPGQREEDLLEVRQLLHQQNVLGHWLTHISDLKNLPTWNAADMVPERIAIEFLATNSTRYRLQNEAFRVQLIPSGLEGNSEKSPVRTERKTGHLKIVGPHGAH